MKFVDEKLEDYCIGKSTTPSAICDELEMFTRSNVEMSMMLVGRLEASFLGFLIRSLNVKSVLEVGTFTGYSALAMAENLPADGNVTTIDINEETTNIAKSFWEKSPHGKKIEAKIGSALEIIPSLEGKVDLMFIDADKVNYLNYLKLGLEKLSDKGIVVLDNCLWSGKVLEHSQEESTKAIQKVNDFIEESDDLYGSLLPVRDGMFLVQKRKS